MLANFEQEWRTTLNDIRDEQLSFAQDLKILLLPLVDDDDLGDDDLQVLLADPTSPRWTEKDIDHALQIRLGQGESHTRFVEISKDLQLLIQKLLALVGVDKVWFQAQGRDPIVGCIVQGLLDATERSHRSHLSKSWPPQLSRTS